MYHFNVSQLLRRSDEGVGFGCSGWQQNFQDARVDGVYGFTRSILFYVFVCRFELLGSTDVTELRPGIILPNVPPYLSNNIYEQNPAFLKADRNDYQPPPP